MAVPTIAATRNDRQFNTLNVTINPPAGIQDGDLLVTFVISIAAGSVNEGSAVAKGWERFGNVTVNSRYAMVLARVYSSATPTSDYTILLNAQASPTILSLAVRGHAVTSPVPDITLGAAWRRQDNGGSQTLIVAPSVTAPAGDSLALAFMMEATTIASTRTLELNGFTLIEERPELSGESIDWGMAFAKPMDIPGPTGDVTATFDNASLNGYGFQLVVPGVPVIPDPQDVPTRVGVSNGRSSPATYTVTPPSGIAAGDLLVLSQIVSTSTGTVSDYAAKGWWRLVSGTVNTGRHEVFARIYDPADPASDYTLTRAGAVSDLAWVIGAVRGHGITQESDFIISSFWTRAAFDNNGLKATAPSLTAPSGSLVLAMTSERTNALGGYTVTTGATDFTKWGEQTEGPTANAAIGWATMFYREMPVAGASGDLTITYTQGGVNNASGVQIAIPHGASPAPSTGQVQALGTFGFSQTSLTVGSKKTGGTAVQAVLFDSSGVTELSRQSVSYDSLTYWGNTSFTELTPGTEYLIRFEVDGEVQTDADLRPHTLAPVGVPTSFTFATGSCQHTGSDHPIFDRIAADEPAFFAHMGDLHYVDATTDTAWRVGVESSLRAPRFAALLDIVPMNWGWDNHDRILADAGGTGGALNFGVTDPATLTQWRHLRGSQPLPDTNAATWVHGRARFIQTDMWTVRDDPDFATAPRTFLGAAQKQWWKDTLEAAEEPIIFWFANWPAYLIGSGRWGSYPDETNELVAWLDARPHIKRRMVMFGGDSHSIQADDGGRTPPNFRFKGIPSLNISGLSRTSDSGSDNAGWNIVNAGLRAVGQPETIGGYGRCRVEDNGASIRFIWEGVRVLGNGAVEVVAWFERTFTPSFDRVGGADTVFVGNQEIWRKDVKGTTL